MKKEQKRLGNKGFSLVELIVVIAIMAVLVAVIAPTLIGKIEESRESTDLSTLGEIKTQVTNALSDEKIYKELVPASGVAEYELSDDCEITGKTDATAELQTVLEKLTWKSNAANDSGMKTLVYVTDGGKVYVKRATAKDAEPAEIDDGYLEVGNVPAGVTGSSGEGATTVAP